MIDRSQFTAGKGNPDHPVPLADGVTVPTERMARLLAGLLDTDGCVLEFGTGSGYQSAILAENCKEVLSVDVGMLEGVADKLPENVTMMVGDAESFDTGLEFDGVLVTFAAPRIMANWTKQLREGGRLIVPLQSGNSCRISVYQKHEGKLFLIDVPAYAPFTCQKRLN